MICSTLGPLLMQVIPLQGIYEHEVEDVKWNGIYNYGKPVNPSDVCVCVCVLVNQSCPVLCHPVDCSPPGSSVHGILQARILEWVAIPLSRGSSQSRDQTWVSCIASLVAQVVKNLPAMQEAQVRFLGQETQEKGLPSWRREWQHTSVFLPGKSHGQRSLTGYSPWGRKESDTTQ